MKLESNVKTYDLATKSLRLLQLAVSTKIRLPVIMVLSSIFHQLAGVHSRQVHTSHDGTLDLVDVKNKVRSRNDAHEPLSRLICVEQTHNGTGGRVLSLDYLKKVMYSQTSYKQSAWGIGCLSTHEV